MRKGRDTGKKFKKDTGASRGKKSSSGSSRPQSGKKPVRKKYDDDQKDDRGFSRSKKSGGTKRFEKDDRHKPEKKSFGKTDKKDFKTKDGYTSRDKSFDKGGKKEFKKDDNFKKRSYSGDKKYDTEKKDGQRFGKRDGIKSGKDRFAGKEKKEFKKGTGFKPRHSANDSVLKKNYRDDDEFPLKDYYREKKDLEKARRNFKKQFSKKPQEEEKQGDGLIRLNRYIANTGVCSRREADKLIEAGAVKVNGKVVTQLGTKISPTDKVQYGNETLRAERNVYILLNKPKDYITTMDDPEGRKTVMSLIRNACKERVYPVGRLDRNTTGILLFTNDGELTRRLTHPRFLVSKVYHVFLNKNLAPSHLKEIRTGLMLEDGFIKPDDVQYAGNAEDKKQVGIEIHSGRNRIVRRIFEHLGYEVVKLDRVSYAGLTKKDVSRGKWRFLSEKEVGFLKMLNSPER